MPSQVYTVRWQVNMWIDFLRLHPYLWTGQWVVSIMRPIWLWPWPRMTVLLLHFNCQWSFKTCRVFPTSCDKFCIAMTTCITPPSPTKMYTPINKNMIEKLMYLRLCSFLFWQELPYPAVVYLQPELADVFSFTCWEWTRENSIMVYPIHLDKSSLSWTLDESSETHAPISDTKVNISTFTIV